MNPEEMRELEDLLRAMPLRKPPERLQRRVAQIERAHRLGRRRVAATVALAATLAVAAALVVMLLTEWRDRGPDVAKPTGTPVPTPAKSPELAINDLKINPVEVERVWSMVSASGVEVVDGETPMRLLRQQTVRHVEWIDDERNVHVQWNIPSEEVVLVPLEYN